MIICEIKQPKGSPECQSHNDGIQELSSLLDQITLANSRPEIMLDNLREQAVWGRKCTDSDVCSSLFTLRNSMKELPKILQRGSLHNLIEWAGRNLKY
jgi:phage gp46-like protein